MENEIGQNYNVYLEKVYPKFTDVQLIKRSAIIERHLDSTGGDSPAYYQSLAIVSLEADRRGIYSSLICSAPLHFIK